VRQTDAFCKASWTSLNYRGLKLSFVPGRKKQSAHPERSEGMRFNPIKRNGVRGTEKQVNKGKTPGVREPYLCRHPRNTDQIHFGPRLNLFKTLVPLVKIGSRSELQMESF
jgi:hypothetical protein